MSHLEEMFLGDEPQRPDLEVRRPGGNQLSADDVEAAVSPQPQRRRMTPQMSEVSWRDYVQPSQETRPNMRSSSYRLSPQAVERSIGDMTPEPGIPSVPTSVSGLAEATAEVANAGDATARPSESPAAEQPAPSPVPPAAIPAASVPSAPSAPSAPTGPVVEPEIPERQVPTPMSKRSEAVSDERVGELRGMSSEEAYAKIMADRQRMLSPFVRPSVDKAAEAAAKVDNSGGFWNRLFGFLTGVRTPRLHEASTKRSKAAKDREKRRAKERFNARGVGKHIYGKLLASPTLGFREVAIGVEEIIDVIRQNPKNLIRLMSKYLNEGEELGDIETWTVDQIVNFFATHDVYVSTFKPPDNQGADAQRRILRVRADADRAIYVHPIMAAMYTADYDGDDMNISLDPKDTNIARDPMSYMVNYDGKILLDMKWLPVAEIMDDWEEGKKAYEYIRDIMLADLTKDLDLGDASMRKRFYDLADAIMKLGKTANLGEDEQKNAYTEFFLAARKFADWISNSSGSSKFANAADATMSGICQNVYQGMRNLWVERSLDTIGITLPADMLPEPKSQGDHSIVALVEGMVRGVLPNNFQELRVMMNTYLGITGKYNENGEFEYDKVNAPFRFAADIGKMMKVDTRLQIGNDEIGRYVEVTDPETGEKRQEFVQGHYNENDFEVDLGNDQQMAILFQSLMKYQQSERMAKEIKKAGRVEYQSQRLRELVISEVGFLNKSYTLVDGSKRMVYVNNDGTYNYGKWLDAFARSYRKHSAIINQSYLSWLSNMELSGESNERVVSPLNSTRVVVRDEDGNPVKDKNGRLKEEETYRFGDLAEPILAVYGSHSVEKMFQTLSSSGSMTAKTRDPNWIGNPNTKSKKPHFADKESDISRRDGRVVSLWVTGKYMTHNLRKFSHENRLVTMSDKEIAPYRSMTINDALNGDSREAELGMLLTIADKATGAASKHNKAVYGIIDKDGRNNGIQSGEKTTIQMWSDLGSELKDLSMQGTVIQSSYYAGIGSRETPDNVLSVMTRLARKLDKSGFRLRSGHAPGADLAFESGAGKNSDIYLPYKSFNGNKRVKGNAFALEDMSREAQIAAEQSFNRHHPIAGRITERTYSKDEEEKKKNRKTRSLHMRNHFQVAGVDGAPDSAFVACYSPNDGKSHGTDQAIRIATAKGIPVFNAADYMKNKDDMAGLARWEADVMKAATKVQAGQMRRYSSRDQMLWVDDIVATLVESGPEMFTYFNMDSSAGFLNSKWGKLIVDASGDLERLGSIRTAMIFEYRMRYVTQIMDNMKFDRDLNDERAILDSVRENNNLKFAIDELADSSEIWHGIISEMKAEDTADEKHPSYFQAVIKNEKPTKTRSNGTEYKWSPDYLEGNVFWKSENGPNPSTHKTLRSVIEDPDIPRDTKWRVICDVVRYWENDPYLKSYEVGYQMEIGNDSTYALGTAEKQGALKAHNDFADAFTRWSKVSRLNMRKEIKYASSRHRNNEGALMQTLQRLDARPWELVSIDNLMYADSILSVKDKTYAQTEKASQHPWTNAIYAAVSFQRNGGFMNDVTRTDDRFLGIQSIDSVDMADVIHILADPTAELWVYNRYGEIGYVSREVLLTTALGRNISADSVTEKDIWEFLEKEPRIASAIRRHNACVRADVDGTGYIGALNSINETIDVSVNGIADPLDHVKYLMRDHPVYAGIISLASKSPVVRDKDGNVVKDRYGNDKRIGSVTRNERSRIADIEDYLCRQMYAAASSRSDPSMLAAGVLASMGITEDALRTALRSNYDSFLSILEIPRVQPSEVKEESETDAKVIFDTAVKHIGNYISEIRDNVQLTELPTQPKYGDAPKNMGVDVVSAASFWDVIQELGGAKTSVSTGIEGAETYNYGNWASHITAKDRYADLEHVVARDDVDASWNNAWTNISISGEPVRLTLDESGRLVIMYYDMDRGSTEIRPYQMDELADLKTAVNNHAENDSQRIGEIVVLVPDGYTVHDRSSDSYGNPLTSLSMFMVSKRSNGAETFNLKAKKAGYDGTDSIIKMQGKYRMVRDEDENGNPIGRRVNFYDDFRKKYSKIASDMGIDTARLELAKELMAENQALGYKDLTLANYMCLAELMLVQGDNGAFYVRSLEMLFSAIKYRIGEQIDEMSEDEIRAKVSEIINDTSDTGVGIGLMATQEAFNSIRPHAASQATNGIKLNASNFARNYDLMESIANSEPGKKVDFMAENEAARVDEMMRNVPHVGEFLDNIDVTRGYRVVGYLTTEEERKQGKTELKANFRRQIGPRNLFVIDGSDEYTAKQVKWVCQTCYDLGMTVVISHKHLDKIPSEYFPDAMVCSEDGDALIPMFDIRLNGSEAKPYNGGSFSIFQAPYDRYTVTVEDSINFYELGDAQYKPLKWLVDRVHLRDSGSVKIKASDLFPNVYNNGDFNHHSFSVSMASPDDIRRISSGNCTIDYGIVEGARGFDQRRHDVELATRRYMNMIKGADNDVQISQECRPGDIVCWMRLDITDNDTNEQSHVLAPVIPFPLHGSRLNVPSKFRKVQMVRVRGDNDLFAFDWENTSSIARGFAKFFDSSGGANKGMVSFADTLDEDLMLSDGTRIDMFCAKASTDSRKVGTDRRIKTMISLMAKARMHGYNLANSEKSFPDDPELKERMLHERIPTDEWRQRLNVGDITFVSDTRLNAFINYECRKVLEDGGNPYDYLANRYTEADGTERDTHVMWEFEAMFDQGLEYEHDLLRFLHLAVDPMFCPDGIYDDNEYYTFRLARNQDGSLATGYDTGVLQMLTPYTLNGKTRWVRNNVYIGLSFFGEEYSGFSRPNVDGSSVFLDAANTMAYYGKRLDDDRMHRRNEWATSDLGRVGRESGGFGPYPMRGSDMDVDVPDDVSIPDDVGGTV